MTHPLDTLRAMPDAGLNALAAKGVKILAIMQNQWFRDPMNAANIMERAEKAGRRNQLIARFLFAGCQSGKRLRAALGAELCDQIIWEEASRNIGGVPSSSFPADVEHIRRAIRTHRPKIVLTLGVVAKVGLDKALPSVIGLNIVPIYGPHPAARHATVMQELRVARLSIELVAAPPLSAISQGGAV